MQIASSLGKCRGALGTDYLIGMEQKIPDRLITFLEKAKSALGLGITSRFDIMGFKHELCHFGAVAFLFNIRYRIVGEKGVLRKVISRSDLTINS